MRLFRSRPSGVELAAIGSASALPSTVIREARRWRHDDRAGRLGARRRQLEIRREGDCADRLVVGIADDLHRAVSSFKASPMRSSSGLKLGCQTWRCPTRTCRGRDAHQRLRRRAEHLDELLSISGFRNWRSLSSADGSGGGGADGERARLDDRRAGDRRHAIRRRALHARVEVSDSALRLIENQRNSAPMTRQRRPRRRPRAARSKRAGR